MAKKQIYFAYNLFGLWLLMPNSLNNQFQWKELKSSRLNSSKRAKNLFVEIFYEIFTLRTSKGWESLVESYLFKLGHFKNVKTIFERKKNIFGYQSSNTKLTSSSKGFSFFSFSTSVSAYLASEYSLFLPTRHFLLEVISFANPTETIPSFPSFCVKEVWNPPAKDFEK